MPNPRGHECTCVIPEGEKRGWCDRHKMRKTAQWVRLCQSHDGYWEAWEHGHGPGQNIADTREPSAIVMHTTAQGPGDYLRKMLGCSAKRWHGYQKMNRLGKNCSSYVKEIAEDLVQSKHLATQEAAEKVVLLAIDRFEKKGLDKSNLM